MGTKLNAFFFFLLIHISASSKPNIILIVADDLGHNDVGWVNKRTITPHLDNLVKGGMELSQFYVFKYCAPSRGALMSGRYPFHFGFYNNQDANDYGLPSNFTMLPAVLRQHGGYRTHMIGKWHLGFRNETLTPTFRGYDSFLGYYHMGEDYYTHKQNVKGGKICQGEFLDFSNNSGTHIEPLWPVQPYTTCNSIGFLNNTCIHAENNQIRNLTTSSSTKCCAACNKTVQCLSWNWNHKTQLCSIKSDRGSPNPGHDTCDAGYKDNPSGDNDYSAFIFAKEAIRLISRHATIYQNKPLFLYLPFQSVHGPLEVPMSFEGLYNDTIVDKSRRTHQGMVTALDQAIGNITIALKENKLYNNSIILFTSDNGGPLPSANNYPLRGGKFTDWEGGTRVRAFIHSPLLPKSMIGTVYKGLMHAIDVFPTFLSAANISMPNNTGPVPMDGMDLWSTLIHNKTSPRNEIFYAPVNQYNPEDCVKWGQSCGGAIRVGDFKLVIGYPGDSRWLSLPQTEQEASSIIMQSGGGPGPDGCNYTTGHGCPCHHLNGGPCLFDVLHDKEEKHDLAHDSKYKNIFDQLMKRFAKMSQTGVARAGLVGPIRDDDWKIKCSFLNKTQAFEPYGPDIPWINDINISNNAMKVRL